MSYLEKKMVLVVFPLLFSFQLKEGSISLIKPISATVLGVIVLFIYGFWNSLFNCFLNPENGSWLCFSASTLSNIHHPSYFSTFVFLSMLLAWFGFKNKYKGFTKSRAILYISFTIILQFMIMSLAGVLFLYFFLLFLIFRYFLSKYNKFYVILVFGISISITLYSVKYIPYLNEEIRQSQEAIELYFDSPKDYIQTRPYPMSGNDTRLTMWTVSSSVIAEHPFGVGTGNVDDALEEKLISYHQKEFAKQHYNPHNQFLQIAVEIGIVGFFVFIFLLISILLKGYTNGDYLSIILVANLAFNCLFESMLQRHSGIVFYVFWFCLLLAFYENAKNNHQKHVL